MVVSEQKLRIISSNVRDRNSALLHEAGNQPPKWSLDFKRNVRDFMEKLSDEQDENAKRINKGAANAATLIKQNIVLKALWHYWSEELAKRD